MEGRVEGGGGAKKWTGRGGDRSGKMRGGGEGGGKMRGREEV